MKTFAAILSLSILTACATMNTNDRYSDYTVEVDAISESEYNSKTFTLGSAMKDVDENDLRFKEFASIVSNALQKKGLTEIRDRKAADTVILLNYAVSEPRTVTHNRLVPVFGGGANSTTTQIKNNYGNPIGSLETRPSNPYDSFRPTGAVAIAEEHTVFQRGIMIAAYEVKESLKSANNEKKISPKMLWEVRITSTGSTNDLRKLFPIMIYAASPFIGKNSGAKEIVNLSLADDDKRIKELLNPVTSATLNLSE